MEKILKELEEAVWAHIENPDQLRVLLLLFNNPDIKWKPPQAAAKLYLTIEIAESALKALQGKKLLEADSNGYFYKPSNPQQHEMVMQLMKLDRERPVTLINLIYSRPKDDLKAFADAFKFSKKKEE